jgi:hypothetical protein
MKKALKPALAFAVLAFGFAVAAETAAYAQYRANPYMGAQCLQYCRAQNNRCMITRVSPYVCGAGFGACNSNCFRAFGRR